MPFVDIEIPTSTFGHRAPFWEDNDSQLSSVFRVSMTPEPVRVTAPHFFTERTSSKKEDRAESIVDDSTDHDSVTGTEESDDETDSQDSRDSDYPSFRCFTPPPRHATEDVQTHSDPSLSPSHSLPDLFITRTPASTPPSSPSRVPGRLVLNLHSPRTPAPTNAEILAAITRRPQWQGFASDTQLLKDHFRRQKFTEGKTLSECVQWLVNEMYPSTLPPCYVKPPAGLFMEFFRLYLRWDSERPPNVIQKPDRQAVSPAFTGRPRRQKKVDSSDWIWQMLGYSSKRKERPDEEEEFVALRTERPSKRLRV